MRTAGLPLFDTARATRREAHAAMRDRAPLLRSAVYASIVKDGKATADEVAARIGESVLAVRPRVTELHQAGKLFDTGERRPNASGRSATVWGSR